MASYPRIGEYSSRHLRVCPDRTDAGPYSPITKDGIDQACPVRIHVEQSPRSRETCVNMIDRCPRVDTVSLLAAH